MEELAATATDAFGNFMPVVLPLLLSSLSVPKGLSAAMMISKDFLSISSPSPLAPLEQTLHCYNSLRGKHCYLTNLTGDMNFLPLI